MKRDAKKYSLWIKPEKAPGKELQVLINQLALQYEAPVFVPHLTIVGDIDITSTPIDVLQQKVTEIAKKIQSFEIQLVDYGFLDETYRSLYLLAESLMFSELYNQASSFFPQVRSEHFAQMPHLSLLYGDYPTATKKKIIENTASRLPITFMADTIILAATEGPANEWEEEFVADFSH